MTASSSSSSSTPLLAEANYGSVMARGECATRTRVYATRWYILALFSLLGLFQVRKIQMKVCGKDDATSAKQSKHLVSLHLYLFDYCRKIKDKMSQGTLKHTSEFRP